MPCPFTSAFGIGVVFGGVHTLFVQDRQGRVLSWGVLLTLLTAWAGYFASGRSSSLRLALEVVSVAMLVLAFARLRWLSRRRGLRSPLSSHALALGRRVWSAIGSSWVLAAKVWLAAMLVMEWRGKAHFEPLEYLAVSLGILALMVHRLVARRRARLFEALETYARETASGSCPLGFGGAAARAARDTTGVEGSLAAAVREHGSPRWGRPEWR